MLRRPAVAVLSALMLPLAGSGAEPEPPPRSPAEDEFEIHPTLEIRLFASEPDIVDPVALTFDEWGRAYVVEMRDYPYGFGPDRRPGGTIRLLEDRDGDGRADRSVVFAEGLSFPTSIAAWDGGVLVMASPEVVFLKDTDGDGRSDVRQVVLRGFHLGVTDSNASGLRYALDNWFHGVNGGNGGQLQFVDPDHPTEPGSAAVTLRDRDFRFRLRPAAVELTSHTGGGFGLVFDDWGRSFTPHNVNHLQQRVLDVDDLRRHPGLPPIETTHSISDHGEMARIYAVSTAQTRPNHPEQAGHFSAAGGMGYIGHQGWPAALRGSVLVCDVVGNLVHRDVLVPDGPILRATRAPEEQTREFLASRDNAFRPVGLELGPDGALYLLDMHREVIEHPDYIPKKLLEKQDVRAGDNLGRIYRLAPRGWPARRDLPGGMSSEELVGLLSSPNQWTRLTAQRLLVARRANNTVAALRQVATSAFEPLGRLHALWTLEGLGGLDADTLAAALDDPIAYLRVNGLALARLGLLKTPKIALRAESLLADPHPEVRFLAALTAGDHDWVRVSDLIPVLERDVAFPWSRRAVLSSLGSRVHLFGLGIHGQQPFWKELTPGKLDWARECGEVMGATPFPAQVSVADCDLIWSPRAETVVTSPPVEVHLPPLPTPANGPEPATVAVLEGFLAGLQRREVKVTGLPRSTRESLERFLSPWLAPELLVAGWNVARELGLPDSDSLVRQRRHWIERATQPSAPVEERLRAIPVLDLANWDEIASPLEQLLQGTEPAAIQNAAFEVVRRHREPEAGGLLIRSWPSLAPGLRSAAVNLLVYRPPFHEALIAALEADRIQVGELNLDLEHRRQLLRRAAPDIRRRAAAFISDEEYSNRNAVVEDWLAKLPNEGDPARGRIHFERLCSQCHRLGNLGFKVGPELTSMSHRSVEDLLSNILDPNMAMNPAYVAFTAELADGEEEIGILGAESASTVTLLQAQGRVVEIPRSGLKALRSAGRSLMPEGLETGLTPQDLRDIIACLQAPAEAAAPGPAK